MAIGPSTVVAAPPLSPPPTGLLVAATVIDHDDDRWLNGLSYSPEGCAPAGIWALTCSPGNFASQLVVEGDEPDVAVDDGTFVVIIGGDPTAAIAWDAAAAAVRAAIEAVVGVGNVTVTGTSINDPGYAIEFVGALAGQSPGDVEVDGELLTSTDSETVTFTGAATVNAPPSKDFDGWAGSVTIEPFVAWAGDRCSTFGFQVADYIGRARRAIAARGPIAVEAEFWAGLATGSVNPHLAAADTVILAAAASSGAVVAQLVKGWLAAGGVGRGIIHMSSYLAESIMGATGGGGLRVDQRQVVTITGHRVAIGQGYPGTGPEAAVGEWAYMTDDLVVHRGPVIVTPDGPTAMAQATDKTSNVVEFRAEQAYAVLPTGCTPIVAVELT